MTSHPGGDSTTDFARIDFEALVLGASIGIIITGANDIIIRVNHAFTTWSGHDRDELVGMSFLRLLSAGDRILFSTRTAPVLELSGKVAETAVTILGRNRVPLPAYFTASRTHVDGGGTDQQPAGAAVTAFLVLPRRERSVEEAQLISALHRAEAADFQRLEAAGDLERMAQRDPLTSLLNRAGCLEQLAGMIERAGVDDEVWVYQLGLDHFRIINESLGAIAGDEVLETIARRLDTRFGDDTLLARVGDDEFVIARSRPPSGAALAEDIVELVGTPLAIDDLEIVVSASLGAAVGLPPNHAPKPVSRAASSTSAGPPPPPVTAETLLRNAATAMYEAKSAGRNRWKLFTAIVDDSAINEIRLLGEIRQALLHEQLRLEYQPQLNLRDHELHGFEALIRWDHPDRGVVGPMGFIDVAEKSGLINQVGLWVCRTAIKECARLNRTLDHPVTMSVNVSARQLGDSRLAESITAMLTAHDLEASLLTVEITETGLVTDEVTTRSNLERLHAAGIRLSIDDFGTGHAGFAYLKDFPVDELKIDRSFVQGLDTSAEDTAIIVSCIEVAHALGIDVVAEGIETAEQLDRLTQLGCDIAQGYVYSRPLDAAALHAWLDCEADVSRPSAADVE